MLQFIKKQGRGSLVLLAVMAIAISACGSSSGTPGTNNNGGNNNGGNNGNGLTGAAGAFANVSSYKFSMIIAGGTLGSTLGLLGGATATGNTPFTISGTVVVKPVKAGDIKMLGMEIIEVGGFQYMDLGTGSFSKSAATGSSMADSFSPSTMFSSMVGGSVASGYAKVGSESKNGADCDHYQASAATLGTYSTMLGSELGGATNVTWTGDVWVAKTGGYPMSTAIVAKSSGTIVYEVLFDISNVDDPANVITAPTNVSDL